MDVRSAPTPPAVAALGASAQELLAADAAPAFGPDYLERVYAALTGKVVGVYLGRPFEGWSYERIQRELGDVEYYVHDRLGVPLIVTDDDIAGTITFFRAAADSGAGYDVQSRHMAENWLNYLIQGRSVLWWGGMSNSTEHTAYLRLLEGVQPPASGSMQLNGRIVAEQIGAQIFIDCWGLMCPGMPRLAAELARRAAVVSHDGEAVFAAQAIAAMEAAAFVTSDVDVLLDVAQGIVPGDSLIHQLISDLRRWHAEHPDWRTARELLDAEYGYHRYGGGCHVIPNHGLVILGLLYGGGDFSRSLSIVNTCGWDTDCNSGNLGAILGLTAGLAGIDRDAATGRDWRGPVADRIYLPTADAGRGISDVLREATDVARVAYSAAGLSWQPPRGGARFSFAIRGAVQGFSADAAGEPPSTVETSAGPVLRLHATRDGAEFTTPTFVQPDAIEMTNYRLQVSPALWPGQTVTARLAARGEAPVRAALIVRHYDGTDQLRTVSGPRVEIPATGREVSWTLPDMGGQPIAAVGFAIENAGDELAVEWLDWSGAPDVVLATPADGGSLWRKAVVSAFDYEHPHTEESFRLVQNAGWGQLLVGCAEWEGYDLTVELQPHACEALSVAWRTGGLRRGLFLEWDRRGALTLTHRRDAEELILGTAHLPFVDFEPHRIAVSHSDDLIRIHIDDAGIFEVTAPPDIVRGAVGIGVERGRLGVDSIRISPSRP